MKSFREWLNERELSPTQANKYLTILKKYFNSDKMDLNLENGILEVEYDTVSIYFKNSFLVGFKDEEEGEYYEVSKKLKSIKEIKNIKTLSNFFGKKVQAPKQMEIPSEPVYTYFPESRNELKTLIEQLIKERGNNADLNDIDVSGVENMAYIFYGSKFNGDISKWNVINVKDMHRMFSGSKFNGDISKWDVINVRNTEYMFDGSPLEKNPPAWYEG